MIRLPQPDERPFVRNCTPGKVTFGSNSTLVISRSCGVWVDEHWATFDDFRTDDSVMKLAIRGRISIEYIKMGVT